MPTLRQPLSISQLCDMLGVEPWQLIDVEVNLLKNSAAIVLNAEDDREWRLAEWVARQKVA